MYNQLIYYLDLDLPEDKELDKQGMEDLQEMKANGDGDSLSTNSGSESDGEVGVDDVGVVAEDGDTARGEGNESDADLADEGKEKDVTATDSSTGLIAN